MQLFLMRHGDANPGVPDISRTLSGWGRAQVSKITRDHHGHFVDVQIVLTSRLVRSIQSADILIAEASLACQREAVECLKPQAQITDVEQYLQTTPYQSIIIIGHLPLLGLLIDHFTGTTDARLETASLASIGLEYPAQGLGTLNWIHYAA